jgi:homoserine O-succinyltransferase/O-acetyltransferase
VPVLVGDGNRAPTEWAGKKWARPAGLLEASAAQPEWVTIALINNMPDSALEDTELQFIELLDTASGDIPVHVKLYSLPNIPRTERGQQRLSSFYSGIDDLLNNRFDGVIVTGTEPLHPDLRDEPYWAILTGVLDWAERNTSSTVLSCLAAHAGVLYSDGVPRHRLSDKQFGVFDYNKENDHLLTKGISNVVQTPHSRWNEVREDALVASGYAVLTSSAQGGVNSFAKKKRDSLFVHFQGHPEYGIGTLLKEYRRDIKRFLRRERETYPSMPQGYFNAPVTELLTHFQKTALSDPREERMASFPEATIADTLLNTWAPASAALYRNWFHYLLSRKADSSACVSVIGKTS